MIKALAVCGLKWRTPDDLLPVQQGDAYALGANCTVLDSLSFHALESVHPQMSIGCRVEKFFVRYNLCVRPGVCIAIVQVRG